MWLLYNMTNNIIIFGTHIMYRLETIIKLNIYYAHLLSYRLHVYDGNARGEVPGEHQNWMKAHTFGADLEEFYIKTN